MRELDRRETQSLPYRLGNPTSILGTDSVFSERERRTWTYVYVRYMSSSVRLSSVCRL